MKSRGSNSPLNWAEWMAQPPDFWPVFAQHSLSSPSNSEHAFFYASEEEAFRITEDKEISSKQDLFWEWGDGLWRGFLPLAVVSGSSFSWTVIKRGGFFFPLKANSPGLASRCCCCCCNETADSHTDHSADFKQCHSTFWWVAKLSLPVQLCTVRP